MRAILAALTVALLLTGCQTHPARTKTPTAHAAFATDEEAFAAAKDAYQRYLDASGVAVRSGGSDTDPLKKAVTPSEWDREREQLRYYVDNQLRGTGSPNVSGYVLQSVSRREGKVTVALYTCLDVSQTGLVDTAGNPRPSENHQSTMAFEVAVVSTRPGSTTLLVDRSDEWLGSPVC